MPVASTEDTSTVSSPWALNMGMTADEKRQSSYDAFLERKKIDLRLLLPFVALTLGLMPMVVQARTLQGFHGQGFRLVTCLIMAQSLLLLCITVLEVAMDRFVCVRVPRDQLEWMRGMLMVVYLVSSPVGHGGILYLRRLAAPCPPNVLITDLNFCQNGEDQAIQIDNFMCLIGYAIFYQAMLPVKWKWHVLAWAIGLVALLITGAEHFGACTASGKAALVIMLIFYVCALACQYALQRMLVTTFVDKLARDTLHYESLNEDCNIHSLPYMPNALGTHYTHATLTLTPTTFSTTPPAPGASAQLPNFHALDELSHFDFSNDDSGPPPPPPSRGCPPPTPASSSLSLQLAPDAAHAHGTFSGYVSLLHRPLEPRGPLLPSLTPSLESRPLDSNPGVAEDRQLRDDDGVDDLSVGSTVSSITMPEGLASLGDASASVKYTGDGEVVCADIKSIKPRFGALVGSP